MIMAWIPGKIMAWRIALIWWAEVTYMVVRITGNYTAIRFL